jgi:DNA-binding SARP family transcriptional activator
LVEGERATLQLPAASWIDFEAFERCWRSSAWDEALTLYRGEWLPDYLYAEWAMGPRERLTQMRLDALLNAAQGYLEEGRLAPARAACRQVLETEPWHEPAALIGMRACAGLGEPLEGLRLYRRLAQALLADFGVAPQAETQALYRSLLAAHRA